MYLYINIYHSFKKYKVARVKEAACKTKEGEATVIYVRLIQCLPGLAFWRDANAWATLYTKIGLIPFNLNELKKKNS